MTTIVLPELTTHAETDYAKQECTGGFSWDTFDGQTPIITFHSASRHTPASLLVIFVGCWNYSTVASPKYLSGTIHVEWSGFDGHARNVLLIVKQRCTTIRCNQINLSELSNAQIFSSAHIKICDRGAISEVAYVLSIDKLHTLMPRDTLSQTAATTCFNAWNQYFMSMLDVCGLLTACGCGAMSHAIIEVLEVSRLYYQNLQ